MHKDLFVCHGSARRIAGGDPKGKIKLLLDFTARPGREVPAPLYTEGFDAAWSDVIEGCEELLAALGENQWN